MVGTGISAAQNARFITEEIADPETLIFLGGLVVAVVLAYAGWQAFRGEQPVGAPAAAAPTPAAQAAGAGEPPAS